MSSGEGACRFRQKYLPDGLSLIGKLDFLDDDDKRWLSQIQGRTYAHMFGLVERFIGAKVLELSRDHCLGDQVALEALIRFGDEELKHQELFRRMEVLAAEAMPAGYSFPWKPNDVAVAVLSKSSWAVLALTLHIELFTQAHYRESVSPDCDLSPLFKDALLYHWREEAQHAILDELEWRRVDANTRSAGPRQGGRRVHRAGRCRRRHPPGAGPRTTPTISCAPRLSVARTRPRTVLSSTQC